jgi:uncharacterized protein YecE (DUF72 family)
VELRAGCSSWTSPAWSGRFYPNGIKDGDRLAFYARYFDCVEVDSSYYRAPAPFLVQRWGRVTPPEFRFTLKFPRDLIDPKQPVDPAAIGDFVRTAQLLGEKLGGILLQFAPWFRPPSSSGGNLEYLGQVIAALPEGPRYAVELRASGWFQGAAFDYLRSTLRDRRMAMAWSYLTYVDVPPELTSDFVYLRFIGDHTTIPEEQHGQIRADRGHELRLWGDRLQKVREKVRVSFVFFNNHFAGFAPDSVNHFRQVLGVPEVALPTGDTSGGHQSRLS